MAAGRAQLVDTPAAVEFMREISDRLPAADFAAIASALHAKNRRFVGALDSGPRTLGEDAWWDLLRSCFPTRRRAKAILESVGVDRLGAATADLLDEGAPLAERLARFDDMLSDFPTAQADLPFELLHFAAPDRYWLWTRWIWDPRVGTGALTLLVGDDVDLAAGLDDVDPASERAVAYGIVGEASAVVAGTGTALGLFPEGPFEVDVFLACVYGVYMYTVLRMRMTQEFNRIVPELPALTRRLLGVFHSEVAACP